MEESVRFINSGWTSCGRDRKLASDFVLGVAASQICLAVLRLQLAGSSALLWEAEMGRCACFASRNFDSNMGSVCPSCMGISFQTRQGIAETRGSCLSSARLH